MLFPTTVFAIFFACVFIGGWALYQKRLAWKIFMLLASYVFYGWWNWKFVGLIMASTAANHLAATIIGQSRSRLTRNLTLSLGIAVNLGILGFFKYYSFFVVNAYAACNALGLPCRLPLLDVVLPVGISFFTFQAMSYVIDVYRGKMEPANCLLDFAVYLAFFPQLVAGPIVRARVLIPQIARPLARIKIDVGRAAILILGGLFKKIVIANSISEAIVDPVFGDPAGQSGLDVLFAVYGYAVQIYCDFSAYSDIAIGASLLLGLRFPINFDAPYLTTSIQQFWRRWHISLSSWLRDYLYIPLGGSRSGHLLTTRNVMITFLLGGLWHGAGWTFVAWGALHGVYLTAGAILHEPRERLEAKIQTIIALPDRLLILIKGAVVFHLVCFSWIFFRSETFADGATVLSRIFAGGTPRLISPTVFLVITVGFLCQFMDGNRLEKLWDRFDSLHGSVQALVAAVVLTVILALGPQGLAPFIYFQF